jgi:hypothetical protein
MFLLRAHRNATRARSAHVFATTLNSHLLAVLIFVCNAKHRSPLIDQSKSTEIVCHCALNLCVEFFKLFVGYLEVTLRHPARAP